MTVAEVLSNEELRHHEFPVTREKVFLAHAGVCPLPRRVTDAMTDYLRDASRSDQESNIYPAILSDTRTAAAKLIGAEAEEVALVGPTTLAINLLAGSLKFRKGDNILIYFDDYPSNVYPWMALAKKGVEVRLMNVQGLGRSRARDVEGQVDERTKLVALASCHFISGWRIDVDEIGSLLRRRNILFSLDAIQTLGVFPTRAGSVDFLAADSHKWMLGPCAAGILFVRKEHLPKLEPAIYGANNVVSPGFVAQEEMVFRSSARKFEPSTYNFAGLVGLKEALGLLLELGVENIAAELLRKRAWLVPALQEKGFDVLHAGAPRESGSGIISLSHPDRDITSLHERLSAGGIVTSLRTDRSGVKYIRLSPHFYNTDEDLQRVLELL
jgi:selenocysteine lyase/cysteine desulfurase